MRKLFLAIKKALLHSIDGIKYLTDERAFKHEIVLGIALLIIEMLRNTNAGMRIYLFTSYFIVLIMECFNTAIESVVDRISIHKHELSKKAKDLGSASVFISLLHLGAVWILSWFF